MISLAAMFTAERPDPKAHVSNDIPLTEVRRSAFRKLPLPLSGDSFGGGTIPQLPVLLPAVTTLEVKFYWSLPM